MKGSIRIQFFKWICLHTIIIVVGMAVMLAVIVYSSFMLNRIQYQGDVYTVTKELDELYYMFVVIFPALLFLLLFGVAWMISRRLTEPLARIVRTTQDIRRGDLAKRIDSLSYVDEIRELADALNEAFDRYQDALKRLDRFSSNVSHQFKNPLAAIKTLGETTLKHERDAEVYKDTIGRILEESTRLNNTVGQLLLLSRMTEANYKEAMEDFDLSNHVSKVLDDFLVACEVKEINLTRSLEGAVKFYGIPNLVSESLFNLLDNAVRHTPEKGEIRVHLYREERAEAIVLSVSDSGKGTNMSFRSLLNKPIDVHSDGHGLGLALVADIVHLHKGNISCSKSDLGGAIFSMRFPTHSISVR